MSCVSDTADAATVDAFHRGRFVLVQPRSGHHRAGLDAMLLAATVPDGFAGHLADLGAGAGAAGLAVLGRCPHARAVLAENDATMLACARRTLDHPQNAALSARATLLDADVTLAGTARAAAGLPPDRFDAVIANPPFNDARDRRTPAPGRAAAHVIDGQTLAAWIRTAASIARPGGRLSLIARPSMLAAILAAMEGRFGGIAIRPVHARPDAPAIRMLVAGSKGSRARLALLPQLVLHPAGTGTAFTGEADALINGRAHLAMTV